MLFPVGNVGLQHRQVCWFCDTGAPPDGTPAPGRIWISVRCSAPSQIVPKAESFKEEKLFRAISKLYHSNPVVFLSQRIKLPSRCQENPNPPGEVRCEKSASEVGGVGLVLWISGGMQHLGAQNKVCWG